MYKHCTMPELIQSTEAAITKPVERYGVSVYVDTDADWCGCDTYIDPLDTEGIKIFREFAAKMAAHYKILKIKP